MTANPILIFGLPRSGTTWIGKIFDSHPDTLYRHEPDSVNRIDDIPVIAPYANHQNVQVVRDYVQNVISNRASKVAGKMPLFPKNYLNFAAYYQYLTGIWISRLSQLIGISLPIIGAPRYLPNQSILVWKSIELLGRLPLIVQALPDAIALHIVRHPCGFVASINRGDRQRRFENRRSASEDYGLLEFLLDTPVGQEWQFTLDDIKSMHPDERLAWRWIVFNDSTMASLGDNSRVKMVAYERVCEDPQTTVRELFDFVGLSFAPQVQEFVDKSTTSDSEGYYSVFKSPLRSAWRWREELDEESVKRIMNLVQKSPVFTSLYDEQKEQLPA